MLATYSDGRCMGRPRNKTRWLDGTARDRDSIPVGSPCITYDLHLFSYVQSLKIDHNKKAEYTIPVID